MITYAEAEVVVNVASSLASLLTNFSSGLHATVTGLPRQPARSDTLSPLLDYLTALADSSRESSDTVSTTLSPVMATVSPAVNRHVCWSGQIQDRDRLRGVARPGPRSAS